MTDETKLLNARTKGIRAELLLRDEMVDEAFKYLETEYIKAWGSTGPHEVQAREHFWISTQILGDVRRHLKQVAMDGKLAHRELEDLANKNRPRAA